MKIYKVLIVFGLVMGFVACNNETSLQEYYVKNQEDSKFIALDIPASLIANADSLDETQKATLESVKKVNLLVYPIKEGKESYESEKQKLTEILKNDEYQLLMKFGNGDRRAEVYFTGEDDAIDELVVFGYDDSRGMGVARVLGEDMNPKNILKLMKSLEKGDLNIEGIKGITGMVKDKAEAYVEKDEVNDSISAK